MSLFVQILLHIYRIYVEISIELTNETQKIQRTLILSEFISFAIFPF